MCLTYTYSILITNLVLLCLFAFTSEPVQQLIKYPPHDIKYPGFHLPLWICDRHHYHLHLYWHQPCHCVATAIPGDVALFIVAITTFIIVVVLQNLKLWMLISQKSKLIPYDLVCIISNLKKGRYIRITVSN